MTSRLRLSNLPFTMHYPKLDDVVSRDPRYAYEAYEFLFEALKYTQQRLGRVPPSAPRQTRTITSAGRSCSDGVRDLALRELA